MSGICGIVRFAGPPIEPGSFARWAERLRARGPDGVGTHVEAAAALGLGLLRTGPGAAHAGPITLDGRRWIAADARIDDRGRLLDRLRGAGVDAPREATDAELILHAHRAWGSDCAARLLGDFAFAIWDSHERSLFCARDPLGVKPFFHAWDGRRFAFANDLPALLAQVDPRVDELAIADFLVFGMNRDPRSTAYAAIRRLPPGHSLRLDADGLSNACYWTVPVEPRVEYRADPRDYVEGFREVLDAAVRDRTPPGPVCVHMSGGLDSPAVAAAALANVPGASLVAHTAVYDRLFVDEERRYAKIVADTLGIPVTFHAGDDYRLYERRDEMPAFFAEPVNGPLAAFEVDLARHAARDARVALTGWDGDTLLAESPRPYFRWLLREGRYARLLREGGGYALAERKLLPAGALGRRAATAAGAEDPIPAWLDPGFERRLQLRERAQALGDVMPAGTHPLRPQATRVLDYIVRRSNFFDAYDPGFTGAAVEFRHPMMDLRLVEYCLSLPAYPWCVRKHVLREALEGVLPGSVRERPKTPLAGHPFVEILKDEGSAWIDTFTPCAASTAYINRAKIPLTRGDPDPERAWLNLRPFGLDLWMRRAPRTTCVEGTT